MTKMVGLQNPADMLSKYKGVRFCEGTAAEVNVLIMTRGRDREEGKRVVSWADAFDAEQEERWVACGSLRATDRSKCCCAREGVLRTRPDFV